MSCPRSRSIEHLVCSSSSTTQSTIKHTAAVQMCPLSILIYHPFSTGCFMDRTFLDDSHSMYRTLYYADWNGINEYGYIIFDEIRDENWCWRGFRFYTARQLTHTSILSLSLPFCWPFLISIQDTGLPSDITGIVNFNYDAAMQLNFNSYSITFLRHSH